MAFKSKFSIIFLTIMLLSMSFIQVGAENLYEGDGSEVIVDEEKATESSNKGNNEDDLYEGDGSEVIVDETKPNEQTVIPNNKPNKPDKPEVEKPTPKPDKDNRNERDYEYKSSSKIKDSIYNRLQIGAIVTIDQLRYSYTNVKGKSLYFGFKFKSFKYLTEKENQMDVFNKITKDFESIKK